MAWPSSRFDSIPSEIVAIIFELGTCAELGSLQDASGDHPFVFESSRRASNYSYSPHFPVLVSHVSRKWRAIALNTPSLWSTLYFEKASHLERGRTFLERCSPKGSCIPEFCLGYLLDIVIVTIPYSRKKAHWDDPSISTEELEKLFDLLVPHTVRWRSFYLHVRDNTCKKVARDALGRNCGRAPNMVTLQLYHFEDYMNVDDLIEATFRDPVVCFANDVPKLKHLSLIGVNLPWANSPYMSDLETLELALHPDKIRPPYDSWAQMLRLSPDLKKLFLHYSGPRESIAQDPALAWQGDDLSDLPSDRLSLEKLEHLSLTDMDEPYLVRILERLHIPNVRKLVFELVSEEEDADYSEFLNKCIGAGMDIPRESSLRLSDGFDHSNSSISTIPPTNSLGFPLLPFLPTLTSLVLSALDCKLASLRSLLGCLPELQELEVDFARVCVGDVEPESSLANIFAEHGPLTATDDTSNGGSSHSSLSRSDSTHRNCPQLLPNLKIFRILRLGGKEVKEIIRHRECIGQADVQTMFSHHQRCQPLAVESIPSRQPQRSEYVIKYTKVMAEKDPVLQQLVNWGCCCFPTNVVEDRCETPSAVLRRFEPELSAHERKRAECLSNTTDIKGWTRVIVQSEMIKGEESEELDEVDGTDSEYEEGIDMSDVEDDEE